MIKNESGIIRRVQNLILRFIHLIIINLLAFTVVSCGPVGEPQIGITPSENIPPTPTESPMAARVNDEGILLSEYEAELQRYQAAQEELGEEFSVETARKEVLDYLVSQTLLAQAAEEEGYSADSAALETRRTGLTDEIGGEKALATWMVGNFYDEESFLRALQRDMAAVWMRNAIIAAVPLTADQVHARQILVRKENEALAFERQLQVGADFETLAFQVDPLTGGELGWFPIGYLLQPDVENAAFALQPGHYSAVIQTSYGYHIVYIIERDSQHLLSPDALQTIQRQALEKWMEERLSQSSIEILVP